MQSMISTAFPVKRGTRTQMKYERIAFFLPLPSRATWDIRQGGKTMKTQPKAGEQERERERERRGGKKRK